MPPISTLPEVAASTPSTMLMVVVLPAPLGPNRPTISPTFDRERYVIYRSQGPIHLAKMRGDECGMSIRLSDWRHAWDYAAQWGKPRAFLCEVDN